MKPAPLDSYKKVSHRQNAEYSLNIFLDLKTFSLNVQGDGSHIKDEDIKVEVEGQEERSGNGSEGQEDRKGNGSEVKLTKKKS